MPKLKFLVEKTSVAGIQNSSMYVFVEYKNKQSNTDECVNKHVTEDLTTGGDNIDQ